MSAPIEELIAELRSINDQVELSYRVVTLKQTQPEVFKQLFEYLEAKAEYK